MTTQIAASLADGIAWTHQAILRLVQDLSDEMLATPPSITAPPIGWHVFSYRPLGRQIASQYAQSLTSRQPSIRIARSNLVGCGNGTWVGGGP